MSANAPSRRDLVMGAGAVAAGATALGLIAGQTAQPARAAEVQWNAQYDVVVLGGGVGGTFAAYVAAQGGANTLLVEAGAELGGSILISNAYLHVSPVTSPEEYFISKPTADPVLGADFINEWDTFITEWFATVGVPNTISIPYMVGFGADYATRKGNFDYLQAQIEGFGGTVVLNTKAVDLVLAEDGSVAGAVLSDHEGNLTYVGAQATIIATGGFTCDPVLKQALIGEFADQSMARTVPYNTGLGHRMALKAGGKLSKACGMFYGHLIPYPNLVPQEHDAYVAANKDDLEKSLMLTQYIAKASVVVNLDGKRFADECSDHIHHASDCWAALNMTRQPLGYGYVITDSADDTQVPNIERLAELGAVVYKADTLEELVEQLGATRGLHKGNLRRTLEAWKSAQAGDELEVYSSAKDNGTATALDTAPFYAIQVGCGVGACHGGIVVNTEQEVLDANDQPIPGLYAITCCAGGYSYDDYPGSLSLNAVTGKGAAEAALKKLGLA